MAADATPSPSPGVVVGLGAMGANHLRVAHEHPRATVVAAVDPDPDRLAAGLATRPSVTGHTGLAEALAAHPELEWACLAVPVDRTPGLALLALEAGLHVLAEKPTAPTEAQARAMIDEADRRERVLAIGHIERCNPAVVALKERIDAGEVGRVLHMTARRLSPFPDRQGSRGVALDLSTHDIDVMRFLTGLEVARVQAETASFPGSEREHEDSVAATLRFDDGTVGLVETSWMSPTKVRELVVFGERGMLTVDYLTQDLVLHEHPSARTGWDHLARIRGGGGGAVVRYALERQEPLVVEWDQFLAATRDPTAGFISGRDGLAALSTALAIREAAERHEAVVPGYRAAARA